MPGARSSQAVTLLRQAGRGWAPWAAALPAVTAWHSTPLGGWCKGLLPLQQGRTAGPAAGPAGIAGVVGPLRRSGQQAGSAALVKSGAGSEGCAAGRDQEQAEGELGVRGRGGPWSSGLRRFSAGSSLTGSHAAACAARTAAAGVGVAGAGPWGGHGLHHLHRGGVRLGEGPLQRMGALSAAGSRRGMAGSMRGGRRAARAQRAPDNMAGPPRNQQIRAREVRLVYPAQEEKPTTVMPIQEALREAKQRGLDLIEVTAAANPPVCKLGEYDKVLYEIRQKAKAAEKAARENRRLSAPKEVRVGCHIAEHDLEVKMNNARRFLDEGHHLRLAVTFRGVRERDLGRDLLSFLLEKLQGLVEVKNPKQLEKPQGHQWAVVLAPAVQKPPPTK